MPGLVPGTITVSDVIEEQIEDDSKDGKSSIRKINRHQVDLRYGQAGAPHYALAIVGNPPDGIRRSRAPLSCSPRRGPKFNAASY